MGVRAMKLVQHYTASIGVLGKGGTGFNARHAANTGQQGQQIRQLLTYGKEGLCKTRRHGVLS